MDFIFGGGKERKVGTLKTVMILLILSGCGSLLIINRVNAQDTENVTTTVTVNNSAPSISVTPYESDDDTSNASTATTPTNEDDAVIFHATGDDTDGDQYYLAICKTDAISANNSAAPTCTGGDWCISSATNDEVAASCSHTTVSGDAENSAWYAFVCDHSADSKCSSSSQGAGDSGSPFVVNHKPAYTVLADDGPFNPGATATFTSTASDTDTYGSTDDNLYLLVCSSAGVTQTNPYTQPSCTGDQLLLSSAALTNPSGTYGISNPYPDDTYTAHGYVYDQHYLLSSTTAVTDPWVVNNITPIISIDTVLPATVTLTESTTANVTIDATITDQNSCQDITSGGSVVVDFYGDWLAGGHGDCDISGESDGDDCYPQITCTVDSGDPDTCTGTSDNSVAYECIIPLQYYAEATGTNSQHTTAHWASYLAVEDDDAASANDTDASVNVALLAAFSSTTSIDYGALDTGSSSPSNQTVTVSSTGNTNIDTELEGTNMTSGGDNIPVANQEYDKTSFSHDLGTDLTTSPVELELDVLKTHWTTSLQVGSGNIYWSIFIPVSTVGGTYNGTITVTAVRGEW